MLRSPLFALAAAAALLACNTPTPSTDDDDSTAEGPFVASCESIPIESTICSGHPGNPGAWLRGKVVLSPSLLATDSGEGDLGTTT